MLQNTSLHLLKTLLPKGQVFTDRASLIAYEVDAGLDKGKPEGIVFPRTAEEVARVVEWAARHHVPLIARGAGTGLSGGAVADRGGVIVEFSHMNHILDVDVYGRSVVAEPAVINLRLDERVKEHDLYFPPDPASQRASTIGGNVAENSGGPHCFKYGVTTNYITGLDVVLADGRRVRVGGRALDYPEYDFCGLITGSEGMLALMTAIYARLVRNPPGVQTMLAIFDTVEQACAAVSAVIAAGLIPATMEMMDKKITGIVEPFAHAGLPLDAEAILIIEIDGYPESLQTQINEIERILHAQAVRSVRVSKTEEERAKIWLARKSVAGAITRLTPAYYTVDITVPRSRLKAILEEVDPICERYDLRVGHLMHAGDGNLHPMVLVPDPQDADLMARVHGAGWEMVKCCVEMGGSLTGEHGVGIEKREYMSLMHTPAELMAMWDVKQVFDPNLILNPGKLFPSPKDSSVPFAGYVQHPENETMEVPPPDKMFMPTTAEEAARGLLALSTAKRRIRISGDRVVHSSDETLLSTHALSGIKTYAPDDLYVTVGAGTPLKEIQDFLTQKGKHLPLGAPWPEATIGGLVAANSNAPLRMRYGSIRDLVLCMTVALADGRVIRTGRPIVKNVAGYDMTKLFIGSHGTLGLLTDVTLKFFPQPRAQRTLLLPIEDMRHGLMWSRHLLSLALTSSAVVLCKGCVMPAVTNMIHTPYMLAYTAEGLEEDVRAELDQVRHMLHMQEIPPSEIYEVEALSGTDIWTQMVGKSTVVRVGLPARSLPAYMQDNGTALNKGAFVADMSSGCLYAINTAETFAEIGTWLKTLRQSALANEGYAVVMSMLDDGLQHIDRWGYQPATLDVMHCLKQRWDPNGVLNTATDPRLLSKREP